MSTLREQLAEGWSSPETYYAHLHLTADDGLVETAAAWIGTAAIVEGDVTASVAGELLARLLEEYLDELDDAGLVDEHQAVRADIGSFSRIDWTEVGAAFLADEGISA